MKPLCDNPKCQHHKIKISDDLYTANIEDSDGSHLIEQHVFRDLKGNFYELCSVCNNAISMYRGEIL